MQTPQNIGRFRIEALVGRGGMGEVYKAFDPTLQRVVALKTVRPGNERPDALQRLYREAQACARLQHPNIVTVYEAGEFHGQVYIAMELLKGDSLDVVVHRGELTFETKLQLLAQILDALDHAHSMGVVHRDIKLNNVQRLPDGSVKLLDFGLARMIRGGTLTMAGTIMGTPHYASPEQLRGERVDHRSDIYSAGALAYEMLSGRRAFQSEEESVASVVAKVLSEAPAPIATVWSRRFPQIEQIVFRAMSKAPDQRYQSAVEMRQAVDGFLATHCDAIAAAEAQFDAAVERTIAEAKRLMASSLTADAESLLTEALRANPDAAQVRTMLNDTQVASALAGPAFAGSMPAFDTDMTQHVIPGPPGQQSRGEGAQTRASRNDAPETAVSSRPARGRMLEAVVMAIAVLSTGGWLWTTTRSEQAQPAAVPKPSGPPQTVEGNARSTEVAVTQPVSQRQALPVSDIPAPARGVSETAPQTATSTDNLPAARDPARSEAGLPSGAESGPPKAPSVAAAPTTSAKQLFESGDDDTGRAKPGLQYRLIQQITPEDERDADPVATFRAGDKVRFAFQSNIDGYLHVILRGSTGRWNVLFPHPEINNGRNGIRRGHGYTVPDDGWFVFDDNPGTEELFVILSREPLDQLPGFRMPVIKAESVEAAVVQQLQQSIRPRDLVYEKGRSNVQAGRISQVSYVVNVDELGKAVTATIALKHGK